MSIEYRTGSLIDTDIHFIAHGVNCKGMMNSGVAKAIRNKWPAVFTQYEQLVRVERIGGVDASGLLGSGQVVVVSNTKTVFNLFTQNQYGYDGQQYVSYDAVASCFRYLRRYLTSALNAAEPVLAIPTIGSGLGGGNWKVIAAIIDHELRNEVQAVVYTLDGKIPHGAS